MILILDKANTTLCIESGSLRIQQDNEPSFQRIPITQLEHVIVLGNPLAKASVWRNLAQANIAISLLNTRGKPYATMLHGGLATQLPFRRMQHVCANDRKAALQQARYFLQHKLESYALSVHTLQQHYNPELASIDSFLNQNQQTLCKLPQAQSVSSLMGLEGQQAHAWFTLLAKTLPYRWKFAGRNRQPPRDPVNALLSLSYTLLSTEIHQLIIASGLDPSLGFLHQDKPGRESLMLDFMEIFRSGVDSFVLDFLINTELDEKSFYYRDQEGCRLSKETRPKYFKAWSQARLVWPRPILASSEKTHGTDSETDAPTPTSPIGADWPTGDLRETINGHIMQWREHLKNTAPSISDRQDFEDL